MTASQDDWNVSPAAAKLLRDAFVWDNTFPFNELCGTQAEHMNSLRRMKAYGHNFVSLTVVPDKFGIEETTRRIGAAYRLLRENADWAQLCFSVDDMEAARKAGKLGVGLHFQGTDPFGRDLGMVEVYYKLGIRHALLAYNEKNSVGDGCHERTDGGLSRYGIELIAEMNRVGMIVDCTHTGYRTTMEAMEVSNAPCIFSHSSSRALVNHERNIWDDQVKACAKTGGVVGVNGVGLFLGGNDISTDNLIRHIDHMVQLVGPKHVGYGSDYVSNTDMLLAVVRGSATRFPAKEYQVESFKFVAPEQMPELVEGLLQRGYSEMDIHGILGGNFLRVAKQVWK